MWANLRERNQPANLKIESRSVVCRTAFGSIKINLRFSFPKD
jgi:hypothetical protein